MDSFITIPVECRLTHLIADQEIQLAHGPLTLIKPPSPTDENHEDASDMKEPADDDLLLILQVAQATFRIHRATPFGTTAASPFTYLFKPDVPGLPPGYIKLLFPSTLADAFPTLTDVPRESLHRTPSQLEELRDMFEQVLVDLGILYDSHVLVAVDDLSRSGIESSRSLARLLAPPSPANSGESISPATSESAPDVPPVRGGRALEHGTKAFADYSARLVGVIEKWSEIAGHQIGQALGVETPDSPQSPQSPYAVLSNLDIASEAGSQIKNGLTESGGVVLQAIGDSATSTVATASQDDNAAGVHVLNSVGASVKNAGAAVGNAVLATSAINHSVHVGIGAAESSDKEAAEQDGPQETQEATDQADQKTSDLDPTQESKAEADSVDKEASDPGSKQESQDVAVTADEKAPAPDPPEEP